MKLKINLFFFILIVLYSCTLENNKNIINNAKETIKKNIIKKESINNASKNTENKLPFYYIGEKYYIEGIEYIPNENYDYEEIGLATYYDKELHSKKTINNELNKVTELFGRHKTLPIPSIVKVTNLDNGLSLIVRVNDRTRNNSVIIEVSRKVAQILRFYKEPKIATVKVEILSDQSKQLKIVTESMSDPSFNNTIQAAPTEDVSIIDLNETSDVETDNYINYEQPIELEKMEVSPTDIFVLVSKISSYEDAEMIKKNVNKTYKITTNKENNEYEVVFGPLTNEEAYNLFQLLLSKGYKNSKIIFK